LSAGKHLTKFRTIVVPKNQAGLEARYTKRR